MVGMMEFTQKEKDSMDIARKNIVKKFESDFPEKCREYQEQAKYYNYGAAFDREYTIKEATDKIIYREVYDAVRELLGDVKTTIGEDRLDRYTRNEIAEALKILYYFRDKNKESIYRNNKNREVSYKSNNTRLKTGGLLYRYEDWFCSLVMITNKYGENVIIKERTEEKAAVVEFYKEYLTPTTNEIGQLLLGINYGEYLRHCLFRWKKLCDAALKVMGVLENQQGNLLYVYEYFAVILESVTYILRMLYLGIGQVKDHIKIENYFQACLNELDQDMGNDSEYDLIQNYGMNVMLCEACEERNLWLTIINWLADTKCSEKYEDGIYKLYDARYDISNKLLEDENEIRKYFCEDKVERMDRFKQKKEQCEIIYDWYVNHHLKNMGYKKIVALKAIYRECFLYTDIPTEFKKFGKIKSLVNLIKDGKHNDLLYMSEQELFYWYKIRRGINRENNLYDTYAYELSLEKLFIDFEKKILTSHYRSGHYFSRWVRILTNNAIKFIAQECYGKRADER